MKKILISLLLGGSILGCSDIIGPVDSRLGAEIFGVWQRSCKEELPTHYHPVWCREWVNSDTVVTKLTWWPYTQTIFFPDGTFIQDTTWWTSVKISGRTHFAENRQWVLSWGNENIKVLHPEKLDPVEDQLMLPLSGWLFEENTPLLVELEARWGNGIITDSLVIPKR